MKPVYRHHISFGTLREANTARLPLFKNGKGEPAHSQPDGSDWSPAQWLQALVGELGEWATLRMEYEAGIIGEAEYRDKCRKELADIQIYLDLLASRAFDVTKNIGKDTPYSAAHSLMSVVAGLGTYANDRKKYERGDHTWKEFVSTAETTLASLQSRLGTLIDLRHHQAHPEPDNEVAQVSPWGVDLGKAVEDKFNAVSDRVDCNVKIFNDKVVRELPPEHYLGGKL